MRTINIIIIINNIKKKQESCKVHHDFGVYCLRRDEYPEELIDQENKLFDEQIALLNGFLKTIEENIQSKNDDVVVLNDNIIEIAENGWKEAEIAEKAFASYEEDKYKNNKNRLPWMEAKMLENERVGMNVKTRLHVMFLLELTSIQIESRVFES